MTLGIECQYRQPFLQKCLSYIAATDVVVVRPEMGFRAGPAMQEQNAGHRPAPVRWQLKIAWHIKALNSSKDDFLARLALHVDPLDDPCIKCNGGIVVVDL